MGVITARNTTGALATLSAATSAKIGNRSRAMQIAHDNDPTG